MGGGQGERYHGGAGATGRAGMNGWLRGRLVLALYWQVAATWNVVEG